MYVFKLCKDYSNDELKCFINIKVCGVEKHSKNTLLLISQKRRFTEPRQLIFLYNYSSKDKRIWPKYFLL